MPADALVAAAAPAAAGRERRLPRHRARGGRRRDRDRGRPRTGGELVIRLTNPFQASGDHHAGNQMALANIRERLQLHFDAEASMQSRVADGTYEVTIRLPYITAPDDARRNPAFPASSSPTTRRRPARACATSWTTAGPTSRSTLVDEARNGREALEIVNREKVDIVLLDIRMPEMDGMEAARHLAGMAHPPAHHLHHGLRCLRDQGLRGERDRLPPEADPRGAAARGAAQGARAAAPGRGGARGRGEPAAPAPAASTSAARSTSCRSPTSSTCAPSSST